MKRIAPLLLLVLMAVHSLRADPPREDVLRPRSEGSSSMFVEFDGGINLTFLDGNPYVRPLLTSYEQETAIYRTAGGAGPYIGLSIGREFSSGFGLTAQVAYDARIAGNSSIMIDTCILVDPISGNLQRDRMEVHKEYTVCVDYLSVALLPHYKFDNLFFVAGPAFSFPITRRIEETNEIIDDSPCYYLVPGDDTTRVVTGSLTDVDNARARFSLKFGLGYLINLTSRIDIVPQLGFDVGLTDVLKEDEMLRMVNAAHPEGNSVTVPINRQMRINSLQAMVGIRVHL